MKIAHFTFTNLALLIIGNEMGYLGAEFFKN